MTNFKNETYANPPEKINATNKTDLYYIDDNWRMDSLDLNEYGAKSKKATDFFCSG